MAVNIRTATLMDIEPIAILSVQLGYPITVAETRDNFNMLQNSGNDVVYVAEMNNEIVGWIQLSYLVRIESGAFVEIVGLVVKDKCRGEGIGKQLIVKAVEWVKDRSCNKIKVRTNILREQTHRFYSAAGFTLIKQQKIFEMNI